MLHKNIQNQLKRANASLTHELNECKSALAESNDIRDRCRSALHNQEIMLEKYKKYKDCQIEKEELERKLKASLDRLAQQKLQTVEALKTQAYETFEYKEKHVELVHQTHNPSSSYNGRPTFANPKYLKKAQSGKPCLYKVPFDKDDIANIFAIDCAEILILEQES
ncbi:hypothetical protein Tco_0889505 [Tanacetum coccineum]